MLNCKLINTDMGTPSIKKFKHVKKVPPGDLKQEALNGLKQIDEKAYILNLKKEGYGRIYKYGIVFHKKNCEVAMELAE